MQAGRVCTTLDERGFWARFGRVEHERLEFKASANNLREVIPAMAMTQGGEVVLGVTDDRRLAGRRLDQRTLDAVTRCARECGVDVELEALVVDGQHLTVVRVPHVPDRVVTTADGRLLRRVGSDNVPLRGEQVSRFLRRRRRVLTRLVGSLHM
jgi:ATP-dependent DNA helicase RecG